MAKKIDFDLALKDHGVKKGLDEIDKSTQRLAVNAKGQLTPSLNESNYALMNMSRIVQDAPYGLRGMGNNITFVTEQMAHMKAQGISVTQQLKGMALSLAGPGGVIFAVSAFTSILTALSMRTGEARKELSQLNELVEVQTSQGKFKIDPKDLPAKIAELKAAMDAQLLSMRMLSYQQNALGKDVDKQLKDSQENYQLQKDLLNILEEANTKSEYRTKLVERLKEYGYKYTEETQKQLKTLKEQKKVIQDMVGIYTVAYGNISSAFAANPSATTGPGGLPVGLQPVGRKPGVDLKDYYNTRERFERQFINSSASLMRSEFNAAWDSIFGHANSFFEKMIQNWASLIVQQIGSNIFSGVPILSGLGGIASIFGLARTTTEANKVAQAYNINE